MSDELLNLLSLPVSSLCCVCRICASVIDDATSAVSIFRAGEELTGKINQYLPITVDESDPFPKYICNHCSEQINQFHDLVQKCLQFEEHLRRTLENCTPVDLDVAYSPEAVNDDAEFDFSFPTEIDEPIQQTINDIAELLANAPIGAPCQKCREPLPNFEKSLKHQKEHLTDDSCVVCSYETDSVIDLNIHLAKHFGETIPPHVKTRNEETRTVSGHSCRKCQKDLPSIEDTVEHCKSHRPTDISSYHCVICSERVSSNNLKDHMIKHFHPVTPPLSCDDCANEYPNEKALKYHRCIELRKHKCSICKLRFKSESRLRFHEDFHITKKTYCEICKKDFKFESRIFLHLSGAHQGEKDNQFCCDVCGKTFRWLKALESHQRTHSNERPFACEKCNARFCNNATLSAHLLSHEQSLRLHCMRCDYSTSRKLNLLNHVTRFHKKVSNSQIVIRCNICYEVFSNIRDMGLEDHEHPFCDPNYRSTEEIMVTKLYQCERCDRCFSSIDHLSSHRQTHVNDDISSIYRCRLCDFGFSKHDLLVRHRKVHSNITSCYTGNLSVLIVFPCEICQSECIDYTQLLNHKERSNCSERIMRGTIRPKEKLISSRLRPLKAHDLNINAEGLYECLTCHRTYKNRRRYRLHLATHNY